MISTFFSARWRHKYRCPTSFAGGKFAQNTLGMCFGNFSNLTDRDTHCIINNQCPCQERCIQKTLFLFLPDWTWTALLKQQLLRYGYILSHFFNSMLLSNTHIERIPGYEKNMYIHIKDECMFRNGFVLKTVLRLYIQTFFTERRFSL